jgi:hypothetical protein
MDLTHEPTDEEGLAHMEAILLRLPRLRRPSGFTTASC